MKVALIIVSSVLGIIIILGVIYYITYRRIVNGKNNKFDL